MSRDAGEPSAKRAKVDKTDEEEDALVRRREELVLMDANARANVRAMRKELGERMVREAEEKAKQLKREAKCKKSKRRLWMKEARAEGERLVREAKERFILESDRTLREARLLPEGFGQELRTVCAALEAKNEKKLTRLPPELWEKILDDENLHQNDTLALASTCRFFREKQKTSGGRWRRFWSYTISGRSSRCGRAGRWRARAWIGFGGSTTLWRSSGVSR